jgi:hypothetical protein
MDSKLSLHTTVNSRKIWKVTGVILQECTTGRKKIQKESGQRYNRAICGNEVQCSGNT